MYRRIAVASLSLLLPLLSANTLACGMHFYFSSYKEGQKFPPQFAAPVVTLAHSPTAFAVVGEPYEISFDFNRPEASSDVKLSLTATSNVELEDTALKLEPLEGTITTSFLLKQPGLDSISIKVSGTHNGEPITQRSVIYVRVKNPPKTAAS